MRVGEGGRRGNSAATCRRFVLSLAMGGAMVSRRTTDGQDPTAPERQTTLSNWGPARRARRRASAGASRRPARPAARPPRAAPRSSAGPGGVDDEDAADPDSPSRRKVPILHFADPGSALHTPSRTLAWTDLGGPGGSSTRAHAASRGVHENDDDVASSPSPPPPHQAASATRGTPRDHAPPTVKPPSTQCRAGAGGRRSSASAARAVCEGCRSESTSATSRVIRGAIRTS